MQTHRISYFCCTIVRFIGHGICYNKAIKRKEMRNMNILWYVSVCTVSLSTALAFSLKAENKRLKHQLNEKSEEPTITRRFRSIEA